MGPAEPGYASINLSGIRACKELRVEQGIELAWMIKGR